VGGRRCHQEAFPIPESRLYARRPRPAAAHRQPAGRGFGHAVSGGEVALARRAGFPVEQIALEGIGKTQADLRLAVRLAAGGTPLRWVAVESADEAAALAELVMAARHASGTPADLRIETLVRLNPSSAETQRNLAVGTRTRSSGDRRWLAAWSRWGPEGPLRWRGLHVHVGSQLGAVLDGSRIGSPRCLHRPTDDFDRSTSARASPFSTRICRARRFAAATEARWRAAATCRSAWPSASRDRGTLWWLARVLHRRDRGRPPRHRRQQAELIRPALWRGRRWLTSLGRPIPMLAGSTRVVVDRPIASRPCPR
jgi:hypothetical protein